MKLLLGVDLKCKHINQNETDVQIADVDDSGDEVAKWTPRCSRSA
jgi:hypothetical protein